MGTEGDRTLWSSALTPGAPVAGLRGERSRKRSAAEAKPKALRAAALRGLELRRV